MVIEHLLEVPATPWVAARFAPKFFHVWYSSYYEPGKLLRDRLACFAEEQDETRARRMLEFLWAHRDTLDPGDRSAVEKVHAEVLAGASLLPEPEIDPGTTAGD